MMQSVSLSQRLLDILEQKQDIVLYRYRISQDDYQLLRDYLTEHNQKLLNLKQATRSTSNIDKIFVLYGAEWWRREYTGDWRWQDLLQSIGLSTTDFNNYALTELVECGLKKWQRSIQRNPVSGHRNALGSLMREGGLPIAYFNSSGGWLGRLLEGSLKAISKEEDYETFLRNNEQLIPKSSSREDIILALIDLTEDIHRLVTIHSLYNQHSPIDYLNEFASNWKDELPFPLETHTAQDLLTNLILESTRQVKDYQKQKEKVAHLKEHHQDWQQLIQLQRIIHIDKKNHHIQVEAKLNHVNELSFDEHNLEHITVDHLSISFYLQSETESSNHVLLGNWQGYPIYNRKVIRLKNAQLLKLKANDWCNGVYMTIESPTNTPIKLTDKRHISINPYQNASMYAVDEHLPFLADIILDDNDNQSLVAQYVASNSQNSKNDLALVYVPINHQILCVNHDSTTELLGEFLSGHLYLIAGEVEVCSAQQTSEFPIYHFKTRSKDAHYSYEIRGRQLVDFVYPHITMKAGFKIYRTNHEDLIDSEVSKDSIFIRPIHSTAYQPLSNIRTDLAGVYHILVKSEYKTTVFQQTIGILPENFSYKLIPQSTTKMLSRGKISFTGVNLHKLVSLHEYIQAEPFVNNPSEFILFTQQQMVGKLTLALCTSPHADSSKSLRLRCYFPSNQTLIYDANNHIITNNTVLSVNSSLEGYRVKIFNAHQDRNMEISFYLASNEQIKISYPIRLKANEFLELKPYEWQNIIHTLISYSNKGLDDIVIAEYGNNLVDGFKLRFSYYTYHLDHDRPQKMLELKFHDSMIQTANFDNPEFDALRNQIQLTAFNFASPDTSVILDRVGHQWSLLKLDELSADTDNTIYQGTWLISAQEKSNDDIHQVDKLTDTQTHSNIRVIAYTPPCVVLAQQITFAERKIAIQTELQDMTTDTQHTGWTYLKQLTQTMIHQPLITLNQWNFARSMPEFMITVSIFGSTLLGRDIYHKAMTELGHHWQLAYFPHFLMMWRQYEVMLENKLAQVFQDDELASYLKQQLEISKAKLSEIPIFKTYFYVMQPSSQPLNKGIIEYFLNSIFRPMATSKQSQNSHWHNPEVLNSIINQLYVYIDPNIRPSVELAAANKYMQSTALLPIVLAWLALQNTPELMKIRQLLIEQSVAIYQIKQFDQAWFNEAFEWALLWFFHNSK